MQGGWSHGRSAEIALECSGGAAAGRDFNAGSAVDEEGTGVGLDEGGKDTVAKRSAVAVELLALMSANAIGN